MEAIDYNVQIDKIADLEDYASMIRDAIVDHVRLAEKFSAIRLRNTSLRYDDFLHSGLRGRAHNNGVIEIVQRESALQLAGTILHELAHILVGVSANHNEDWQEACHAVGLRYCQAAAQAYIPEHFEPAILAAIDAAIARFRNTHPTLFVSEDVPIPLPPGRVLLPFQIEDVRHKLRIIGNGKNILLANEMGTGKTPEVIALLNVLKPKRVLVGCPNNAKLIWKRHFDEWSVNNYEVEVASTQLFMFGDVVIMNYEAITKWGDILKRQQWDMIIYDEGHYLKNPSAKRSRACYAIKGTHNIIITGTPIVNYPYEVFPLIHYLDREAWPEYGRFEAMFGSRSTNKLGRNLNRLNAMLRATIMVRRLKKDVLAELPRKRRQIVEFEIPDNARELIEKEKELFNSVQQKDADVSLLNVLKNESDIAHDDIDWAALIDAMRQTKRYAFEEMARIAHLVALAKLPLVYEHIENALEAREKVIVFGHHRDVLTMVADRFAPHSVLLLGGNSDQAGITEMAMSKFNNDDTCHVFVSGTHLAQGYSLQGSSTVIFIEEDWVPGIMTQAEDRAHGIGRGDTEARSMLIQHLVFEDSLDTYKAKLTIKKQQSINRALNK